MKQIVIISIFLLLASCVTERKRLQICESCPSKIETKDSIWDRLVHDTITLPPTQGPTIFLPSPCDSLCDSLGNLKAYFRREHKAGITSTIRTKNNVLEFDCIADSLQGYIDRMEREYWHKERAVITQQEKCKKDHKTKFDGFTWWWFWITAIVITAILLIKYLLKR